MANTDHSRCPGCGGLYILLGGKVHRCSGHLLDAKPSPVNVVPASHVAALVVTNPVDATTYKHRDPDARRAFMRDYMRRYRAKKKLSGKAASV